MVVVPATIVARIVRVDVAVASPPGAPGAVIVTGIGTVTGTVEVEIEMETRV